MFNPGLWRVRRFSDVMPEIMHLQQEMNRLFSSAGQKTTQDYPAVNIWEKDGASIVTAELPGIDSEKMDITVSGDVLSIAGTALKENFDKGETYLRQERGIGNFKRNIQIPYQVDVKAVEAKYEKGILMVTLPRIKEDLPKKIKIK
ncbi:MAG TPA: Hsp20/alpha crystallin family protein [Smithellaceae bacterium]|jgi:HSP20 family protein|nr:Hsp20/alpha crystallin family protein [Smithellaceae bacterium]HQM46885.1 Hsp20/alpha crystallin family protein [Smithellaceae bacterium]HQP24377.1 Hsp20/alpha crystallin family protein [Smithellaceae bacterium]